MDNQLPNQPQTMNIPPQPMTVQPQPVTIQPPSIEIQPPQITVQPPQIAVQPPPIAVPPPPISAQPPATMVPPPIPPPAVPMPVPPITQSQPPNPQNALKKINMNFGYSLKLEQESFFESTILTPIQKIILSFMLKRNHYDYGDDEYVEKRTILTKLIYKASVDGDDSMAFHQKCDNQGATVTIIKTDQGKTFGGFTKFNWDYSIQEPREKCEDHYSFIFSLDTREKIIEFDSFHFPGLKDYGPTFLTQQNGNPTLMIANGCQGNNASFIAFGRMNNGIQNFNVVDYEVFTVFIF
jgi:hypothetical protein